MTCFFNQPQRDLSNVTLFGTSTLLAACQVIELQNRSRCGILCRCRYTLFACLFVSLVPVVVQGFSCEYDGKKIWSTWRGQATTNYPHGPRASPFSLCILL